MIKLRTSIMKKYINTFFIIIGFCALLLFINIFHNKFFNVNVVFYSALFDVVVATFIMLFFLKTIYANALFSTYELVLLSITWGLIGYIYAISVPTLIDRSLSFYLLEKINQQGGSINAKSIPSLISEDYVSEHRLADVRITEQIESGTIRLENGCLYLTDKGRLMIDISGFVRRNILPSKRLLMNDYSSDLIDPLKGGEAKLERSCKYQHD